MYYIICHVCFSISLPTQLCPPCLIYQFDAFFTITLFGDSFNEAFLLNGKKLLYPVYNNFLVARLLVCPRPAHVGHVEPSVMTAWHLSTLQTGPITGLS